MGLEQALEKYNNTGIDYDEIIEDLKDIRKDISDLTEQLNNFIISIASHETDEELVEDVTREIDSDLEELDNFHSEVTRRIKQAEALQQQDENSQRAEDYKALSEMVQAYKAITKRYEELKLDDSLGKL